MKFDIAASFFNFLNKRIHVILLIIVLITVFPFLALSIYVHPYYDDYSLALQAREYSGIDFLRFLYLEWTGRYFNNLMFLIANPLNYNSIIGYKILPVLFYSFTYLAIVFLFSSFIKKIFTLKRLLIFSLLVLVYFIAVIPELFSAFNNFTCAIVYQFPNVLFLLFIAIAYRRIYAQGMNKMLFSILCFLLMISIVGATEIHLLTIIFITGIITCIHFWKKFNGKFFWLALLIVGILCTVYSITAPGNFVRMHSFPNSKNILYTITRGSYDFYLLLNKILLNSPFIIFSLLYIPVGVKLHNASNSTLIKNHFYLHPVIAVFFLLGVTFSLQLPALWLAGEINAGRTLNTIYFLFIMGWLFTLQILISYCLEKGRQFPIIPPSFYNIVLLLAVITFPVYGNAKQAFVDLFRDAPVYSREMNNRYDVLKEANKNNAEFVNLPALSVYPQSIMLKDGYHVDVEHIHVYEELFGVRNIKFIQNNQTIPQ